MIERMVSDDAPRDDISEVGVELAQRIVDQVVPGLPYNVNIMDEQGRIIGSADQARVGTVHAGAVEAVRLGAPVAVRDADESVGTKPGVNMPLILDDRIVGVVGVTGEPSKVENVARVLVLTVELLLRQERQRDDLRWREAAVRDVISGLMNGATTEERLVTGLREIGSPLRPPWNIMAVIGPPRAAALSIPPPGAARLLSRLQGLPNIVAAEHHGALWILQGSSSARTVAAVLHRIGGPEVRFLIGEVEASTTVLNADAQRLRVLLSSVGLIPDRPEIRLATVDAPAAVAFQPPEVSFDLARRVLTRLSPVLRETARMFLSRNLSIADASRELGIHRNTLVQRLARIESLTGLNPSKFDDAVALHLALLAARTSDNDLRAEAKQRDTHKPASN